MKLIPPYCPPGADILVVGEAAGRMEAIQGRQFVGDSGKLLFDHILRPAGIVRERCATANVVPFRPPNNDLRRIDEMGVGEDSFVPQLMEFVESRPWKVVLAVGELAMSTLTGYSGITKWHGSFLFTRNTTPCIPLIHPAAIMRQWDWYEWTKMDAQKVKHILDNGIKCPPPRQLYTFFEFPTPSAFIDFIDGLYRAPFVAFDLETYKGTITCISLAGSWDEAISIPMTDKFSMSEQRELIKAVRSLLKHKVHKVAQNGSYDITYLREWGCEVRHFWLDTMLAHHSIHPELPHSLAFMCNQYTLEPFYKDARKETDSTNYNRTAWEYSARDACITWEVARKLSTELVRTNVQKFYFNHVAPLFGAVCRMQLRGIKVDTAKVHAHISTISQRIVDRTVELEGLVEVGFNPNSPQQVKNLLYNKWLLPPVLNKNTGSTTSNELALRQLARKFPKHSPTLHKILDVKGDVKLRSFLKAELEPDGRMRTFYNISGTTTGRLSSGENIWGRGTNLQNIPKSIRDIFVPDDGFVLWQADGMQAEDRCVAFMSGEPVLMDAYARGLDTHAVMATILFGIPYEDVVSGRKAGDKKMILLRETAKRIRHGWNYGMGPRRMTEVINVETPELEWNHEKSYAAFAALEQGLPMVVKWRKDGAQWLKKNRVWYSPFGRRRKFTGRSGHDTEKEFFANAPQGAVGDHINSCIYPIECGLRAFYHSVVSAGSVERDCELAMPLLQIHDAIAGQCREEWIGDVEKIVKGVMEKPLPIWYDGQQLTIPCDFKWGRSWKEC